MVTHPDPTRPEQRVVYGLASSGKTVGVAAYRKLAPNLRPIADGLFADTSQTFEWVETPEAQS